MCAGNTQISSKNRSLFSFQTLLSPELRAHHADLIAHSKTTKHQPNAAPFSIAWLLYVVGVKRISRQFC